MSLHELHSMALKTVPVRPRAQSESLWDPDGNSSHGGSATDSERVRRLLDLSSLRDGNILRTIPCHPRRA